MKIIEIEWVDAHRRDGWQNRKELDDWGDEAGIINQVGYFVKEDKKWLYISMAIGEDNTYLNSHKIPKGMIVKREEIKKE